MSLSHIHIQRFDGDDPYLVCQCGTRWDARTGAEITESMWLPRAADLRGLAPEQAGRSDRNGRSEGLDVERLARALLRAVPGYQRWMDWPVLTQTETQNREDALDAELYAHARAIAAAYYEEAES